MKLVLPSSSWYGSDKETRQIVRGSVHTEVLDGSIQDFRHRLEAISSDFEESHGRPLFRGIWQVVKEGVGFVVALLGQVHRLCDIPIAMALLEDTS